MLSPHAALVPTVDPRHDAILVTDVDGRPSVTGVAEADPFQSDRDRERKPLDEPTPAELDALILATRLQLARACVAKGAVALDLGCDGWGDALELGAPSDILGQLYDSREIGLEELAPEDLPTDEREDWAWRHGFAMPPAAERWPQPERGAHAHAMWLAWIEQAMIRRQLSDPGATWPPAPERVCFPPVDSRSEYRPLPRDPLLRRVEADRRFGQVEDQAAAWEGRMAVPRLASTTDAIVAELERSWGAR